MAAVAQLGTHMHHAPSITKSEESSHVVSVKPKDAQPPALIRNTEFARETYAILHKTMFTLLRDRGRRVNGHADGYNKIVDPKIDSAQETLIRMCREFMRIHGREADRNINKLDLSISMRHQVYHQTAEAMFEDEVNWGRIIAYVSFTIAVAEKVYDMYPETRLKTQMVEDIEVWLNAFFFHKLQGWIAKFGGWGGLVTKFSQDKVSTSSSSSKDSKDAPAGGQWLTLAAVGVGVLVTTALLTR